MNIANVLHLIKHAFQSYAEGALCTQKAENHMFVLLGLLAVLCLTLQPGELRLLVMEAVVKVVFPAVLVFVLNLHFLIASIPHSFPLQP